jgi:hypothetical protein
MDNLILRREGKKGMNGDEIEQKTVKNNDSESIFFIAALGQIHISVYFLSGEGEVWNWYVFSLSR